MKNKVYKSLKFILIAIFIICALFIYFFVTENYVFALLLDLITQYFFIFLFIFLFGYFIYANPLAIYLQKFENMHDLLVKIHNQLNKIENNKTDKNIDLTEIYDDNNNDNDNNNLENFFKNRQILDNNVNSFFEIEAADKIPETYEEAVKSEHWNKACNKELSLFFYNIVYEEVDRNEKMQVLSCTWNFSIKYNFHSYIDCFKANLVIQDYVQKDFFPFENVYALHSKIKVLHMFLTISKIKEMSICQINVSINKNADGYIYLNPPIPYLQNQNLVWKLKKAHIGLKQTSQDWFDKISDILWELKFYSSKFEKCLFFRNDSNDEKKHDAMIFVDVNDFLISAENNEILKNILEKLEQQLKIIKTDRINEFMGVEFQEQKNYILATQKTFVSDLVKRFIPLNQNNSENNCFKEKCFSLPNLKLYTDDNEITNPNEYAQLLGSLMYISSMTRPDICSTVNFLIQKISKPTKQTIMIAKHLLNYCYSTNYPILFGGEKENCKLLSYVDASLLDSGCSQTGVVFFLGKTSVLWYCKTQKKN